MGPAGGSGDGTQRQVVVAVLSSAPVVGYSGGALRRLELTRAVGRVGRLVLLVLAEIDDGTRAELSRVFQAPVVVAPPRLRPRWKAVLYWMIHLDSTLQRSRLDYTPTRTELARILDGQDVRAIWCSGVDTWPAVPRGLRPAVILDVHDLPSASNREILRAAWWRWNRRRAWSRRGEVLCAPARSRQVLDHLDGLLRSRVLEKAILREARGLVTSSALEAGSLPGSVVIPNGANPPAHPLRRGGSQVTFVFPGQFGYTPNQDGAEWFASEILPLLRSRLGNPRVVFAGSSGEALQRFGARHGIEVTGFVEDFDSVYDTSTVVVVPLRTGSGTRIKIIEAWARGLPVVSTTKGAEGLDGTDGEDLLIADTPEAFSEACARLAEDAQLRAGLSRRGVERFREGLSWDDAAARLERWLGSVG